VGLDADLSVEVEAVETSFTVSGEVQWALVLLSAVVGGGHLGVLARRGGGEGVSERERVLVVGRCVVAGVEQGASAM
jgi:hypothetical protein